MRNVPRQTDIALLEAGTRNTSAPETLTYRSAQRSVAAENSTEKEGLRALEFLGHLVAELARGTVMLRCFPNVVVQIRAVLSNPGTTLKESVKLISTEPVLAN